MPGDHSPSAFARVHPFLAWNNSRCSQSHFVLQDPTERSLFLRSFYQTPMVPHECSSCSAYHCLLSLICLDSPQTTGASPDITEQINEGRSCMCKGSFLCRKMILFCSMTSTYRCARIWGTQKELQCLPFQNRTGGVVLSWVSKRWAIVPQICFLHSLYIQNHFLNRCCPSADKSNLQGLCLSQINAG